MSYRILLFVVLILIAGCKGKNEAPPAEKEVLDTSPWISLMDVEAWRGYNQDQLPDNWAIEDGVIACTGKAGDMGGDIITRKLFDNFELQLEWKISKGGNSGVFYHVVESPEFHSPYETGPEYQLLDDLGFPDPLEDWQKTGANYAMHNARANKKL